MAAVATVVEAMLAAAMGVAVATNPRGRSFALVSLAGNGKDAAVLALFGG